mgnify:CR=1 FL=1
MEYALNILKNTMQSLLGLLSYYPLNIAIAFTILTVAALIITRMVHKDD